jgi:BlaI family transcriptional regulator, penicillinase repressor
MRRSEPKITPAQLEIMNLIWEHGELGVAEVWDILAQRRKVARNTVQTTLTRLVQKGWLRTRVVRNSFRFRAAQPRKATLRQMVRQLLDTAFGGSPSNLVTALLEGRPLSPEEAARIRKLIERAEGEVPK